MIRYVCFLDLYCLGLLQTYSENKKTFYLNRRPFFFMCTPKIKFLLYELNT